MIFICFYSTIRGLEFPPWQSLSLAQHHVLRPHIVHQIIKKFCDFHLNGIVLLFGMGGCGKTSLCLEITHNEEVKDFFPGGQFVVCVLVTALT